MEVHLQTSWLRVLAGVWRLELDGKAGHDGFFGSVFGIRKGKGYRKGDVGKRTKEEEGLSTSSKTLLFNPPFAGIVRSTLQGCVPQITPEFDRPRPSHLSTDFAHMDAHMRQVMTSMLGSEWSSATWTFAPATASEGWMKVRGKLSKGVFHTIRENMT